MFSRFSSLSRANLRSIQGRLSSSSAKSFESSAIQISLTDDGRTIVMYHPEQGFPYEHTKPLPVVEAKFKEEDSVFKMELREDIDEIMFEKDLTAEELIKLTNQSRRFWRDPNFLSKYYDKRKELTKTVWHNKDREGI